MATIVQDFRYAARGLQRTPSFTFAVIITLGLGIGATTGTFSIANAVLLEPLAFAEPDRLIRIQEITPGGEPFSVSEPTFLDLQRTSRTVAHMAAVAPRTLTLTGGDEPVRLQGAAVSHTLFDLLGVAPAQGRGFVDEEDRPGGPAVVVLSHETWQQRFGADPGILGRTISLDGASHVVVGVMPSGFAFLPADAWVPLRASAQADRTDHGLDVIGRLSDGATLDGASGELQTLAERLGREHPRQAGWTVRVSPLTEWLVGPAFRRTVWVLLGSVSVLLLIVCANVANLLMARGAYRLDEIAIRTALGAGRLHIVRQLLVESLILAAAGGLVGIILSFWIADALARLTADLLVVPPPATIDGRVLTFAAVLVGLTSIAFGLLPAWTAARRGTLPGRPRNARVTSERRRITEGFVIAQVALAMVLLIGSGLMIKSFLRLQRVDPGFVAQDVIAVPLAVPDREYPPERAQAFFRELTTRLESIPGVVSVGATTTNPFRQWGFSNNVTPEDRVAEATAAGLLQAGWRAVTPGFFETLRIPLLRGRAFHAMDGDGDVRNVVVSESLARALWPDRDAVGRRLYWGGIEGRPWTVVGVVGDVRDLRVEAPPEPMLYLPHQNVPMAAMTVVLRSNPGVTGLATPIRRAIHGLDPNLPVPEMRALEANRAEAVSTPRVRTLVLTLIGVVALLLAAVGVYGLVSFGAAQRVREVGIRVAVGAKPADIMGLFLWRGLVLASTGLGAGLAGAWVLSRVLDSLLYQTESRDPLLYVAAAAVLLGVTALASFLPARRAAALDPVRALNRP